MGWIIFIIILICIFGSSDTSSTKTRNTGLSKKDIKRIRKEQERAEMDAYEDMLMYMEVFSDNYGMQN